MIPNKIKIIKYLFNIDYNIKFKDNLKYNRKVISQIYDAFNGSTLINNEEKRTAKERIVFNYRIKNIFHKMINDDFNIEHLFKIYDDFNDFNEFNKIILL